MIKTTVCGLALLVAGATAGCAARIDRFTAMPAEVCTGGTTTLTWSARGTTFLTADPSGPDSPGTAPERVPSQGARTFTVSKTSRFRLQAQRRYSRARPAFAFQEVVVVPGLRDQATRTEPLYARTEACEEGRLVARARVPADEWPDAIRVTRVSARGQGPLRILHEGKMALVRPPLDTDAFQGTSLGGEWRIELETPDGRCDRAPPAVILNATLSCNPSLAQARARANANTNANANANQ
jgi:hypothetical protein